MLNLFDELFLYSDSNYKRYSESKKISWKRYGLSVLFGIMTTGLVIVGICFSAVFDSVLSILVLGVLAVMSGMRYKK
ncbi:MAG: hypothetical protein K0S63_1301 [Gammaproteobacteria bacterium]|jgi:hypothetical protein|nr:hypothetical protein [Gammaproteobacteria bacterium]